MLQQEFFISPIQDSVSYNFQDSFSHLNFVSKRLLSDEGVVFHANKDPEYQRHFHSLVLKWKINKTLKRISELQKELQPKEAISSVVRPRIVHSVSNVLNAYRIINIQTFPHEGYIY